MLWTNSYVADRQSQHSPPPDRSTLLRESAPCQQWWSAEAGSSFQGPVCAVGAKEENSDCCLAS